MLPRVCLIGLMMLVIGCCSSARRRVVAADAVGSRFAYLDERDPYYPQAGFPKLTTPMWVGDQGVDAVILLSVDDMGRPPVRARYNVTPEGFARFLAPLIERLQTIDGRAPISVMTCQAPHHSPIIQKLLKQGLSFECHTFTHRFPFFRVDQGVAIEQALALARLDYLACMENLFAVPGNRPVAHRMPGCDAQNTVSPRFFTEVFPMRTADGRFLTCDTSIMTWFPSKDRSLPLGWRFDGEQRARFDKYVEKIPQTRHFVNSIEDYPYPYVINHLLWELPVTIPCDSHGVHQNQPQSDKTVDDWKRAVDICVRKQGLMNLLFHTIGYIQNTQVAEVIDYADRTYGGRVKFLNCREIYDRLTKNVLGGLPLRSDTGADQGVRLLDVNADGYLDAVIGNSRRRETRCWDPLERKWRSGAFPVRIVSDAATASPGSAGVRFFSSDPNGFAGVAVANAELRSVWCFDGEDWRRRRERTLPAQVDGAPLLIADRGLDRGVRFRDLNNDGVSDLLVNNEVQNAVFLWSLSDTAWRRAAFALPTTGCLVDSRGRDRGLRFVDLDGDSDEDLILSNDDEYWVRLFTSPTKGWSQLIVHGTRASADALPPIVRNGRLNGVWFHAGAMILENEHTMQNEDFIRRIPFAQILEAGRRRTAE